MTSKIELKRKKDTATAILKTMNVDINDWFEEQYDKIIATNQETILNALNQYSKKNKQENHGTTLGGHNNG